MRDWRFAVSSADEAEATAPILLKGAFEDNLIQAARLGYQAVEVHTREDVCWDLPALRDQLQEHRMSISAIVTGRLNTEGKVSLMDDAPYSSQAALAGMQQYIDMAEGLGTDLVIGWVKGRIPPGRGNGRYLKRLAHHLQILNDYGGARNVRLLLEVINRYETNVFNTASATLEFLEANHLNNCFLHLDTFHMGIEEADPAAAVELCGKKLGYMHFADNTREYPGSGQFDFRGIFRALRRVGYEGYLSVECLPRPNGVTAAERALRHLKECIASAEHGEKTGRF